MNHKDLVSIIIPCYNQAQYLEEAVLSAINQTYTNIEIIIVNDGSTDNSEEVTSHLQKQYPEKIRVILQKNSGVVEARNNAIFNASGQYVLPLDGDDKLDRTIIEECINTIHNHQCDIVYTNFKRFGSKKHIHNWKPFHESNPPYITPCSVTALFKRQVWESIGGFNKLMFDGYEDWEFWVNAYKNKFKFHHLNKILFYYRTKDISRDTVAYKKDTYLKAKIIMIHPELYTTHKINQSIEIIKDTEKLPNIFLYHNIKDIINEKYILSHLNDFFSNNTLKDKQIINLPDKTINIMLYSLDILDNEKSINVLYKKTNNLILFYSSVPYIVPKLKIIDYAWSKNSGIIKAYGSNFDYVFKTTKENSQSQLIAFKHLEKSLIRQENMIQNKCIKFDELHILLKELSSISVFRHPITKIKRYKKLIATYYKK